MQASDVWGEHADLVRCYSTFESFMMKWEKLTINPHSKTDCLMPGLEWAYKYYEHIDHTKVYVIAMCK